MSQAGRPAVGRAALLAVFTGLGCAPTPMMAPINQSHPQPDRRTVYTIDWRAEVRSDTENQPPIGIEAMRYDPVETVTPLVVPIAQGLEVVAGASSGELLAVDTRGKTRWVAHRPGALRSGLATMQGRIYFGSADGTVAAVDAETGQPLWSYNTGEEPGTTPVMVGGLVLVATHEQTLFALDAASGAWRWQYHRDQPREFTIRGVSRPLVVNDQVFVGFADGSIVCLRAFDGAVVWQIEARRELSYQDSDSAPQTDGQRIFATSYRDGLLALSMDKGEVVWQHPFAQVNHLAYNRGTLFATAVGKVAAFSSTDGAELWSKGTSFRTASGIEVWKGLLMVPTEGPLFFLDGRTGRPLGDSFNPGRGISAVPGIYGRSMYIMSNAGWLYAMSLK
jgi:outer membrane protein assembly factor BamB